MDHKPSSGFDREPDTTRQFQNVLGLNQVNTRPSRGCARITNEQKEIHTSTVINRPTREQLNERQLVEYKNHKQWLIDWFLHVRKDPAKAEGYACTTVSQVTQKVDEFYCWVWDEHGTHTPPITAEDAENYVSYLIPAEGNYTTGHISNIRRYLQRFLKWRRQDLSDDVEREPARTFSDNKLLNLVLFSRSDPPG